VLKDPSDSEVTNFDISFRSEENILSFEISMEDLFVMNVIHRECHLNKPGDDLVLGKERS